MNTSPDLGHNQPPDPDGERGQEAIRDYDISVAKEQVEREDAIDAAVRYGNALRGGRAGKSNNKFGDWIVAQELDRHPIFEERQERSAAMQIAEIVAHIAKETVDGTATVNPFRGCPNSRPTNIMKWWRKEHGTLWTMAEAKKTRSFGAHGSRSDKARVKKAVDARMAKERMYSSPLTESH